MEQAAKIGPTEDASKETLWACEGFLSPGPSNMRSLFSFILLGFVFSVSTSIQGKG